MNIYIYIYGHWIYIYIYIYGYCILYICIYGYWILYICGHWICMYIYMVIEYYIYIWMVIEYIYIYIYIFTYIYIYIYIYIFYNIYIYIYGEGMSRHRVEPVEKKRVCFTSRSNIIQYLHHISSNVGNLWKDGMKLVVPPSPSPAPRRSVEVCRRRVEPAATAMAGRWF